MNFKKLTLAAAAGTTLFAAAPVFANPPHWAPAYGWHARHHYHPRPVVIYAPAPVYYAPRPVYVPPPVVYYPPPQPVIYGQVPLGHGSRIGFSVGL